MTDIPALPPDDNRRVAIENITPVVDAGRFAVKRVVGDTLAVSADVFADGHDVVRTLFQWRMAGETSWREEPMTADWNDRWHARLELPAAGRYEFAIAGWVDAFDTWHRDLQKRIEAGQEITVDLAIGAQLVRKAIDRASGEDRQRLAHWNCVLSKGAQGQAEYLAGAAELVELMTRHPDRGAQSQSIPYAVVVEAPKAQFSAWYELFPRSCSGDVQRHGTLADCIGWLPRLAELGFDVVYLPPIHPIGEAFRKGKNNALVAESGDCGSPWAIGAAEGGHKAIHRQLGTLDDLKRLLTSAREQGIDIALDIAFQCSPDHPYVQEHPQWFRHRPDGTIQYAENPPKKYQDIYPFDFDTADWQSLWQELTEVVLFWCRQGVRVFRVDNPHTKPFAFWEYLIAQVKAQFPETIFLSEAFTRPRVMYRLAKLGFSQSYTYFTWRNTKAEFVEYFTELTDPELRQYFRPNLWPNTPDILPEHLQTGGRPAFVARLALAATLGANYGIYGPAYETMQHVPREHGSEEYLDSEKYEIKAWSLDAPDTLRDVIARINRARRENVCLQSDLSLRFHPTDNEHLLCYSKHSDDGSNWVVVVVNLDFHQEQHGFVELPLEEMGLAADSAYQVEDLLNGQVYSWQGARNFVELDPEKVAAHVFRIQPRG